MNICSICNEDIGTCKHIPGMSYDTTSRPISEGQPRPVPEPIIRVCTSNGETAGTQTIISIKIVVDRLSIVIEEQEAKIKALTSTLEIRDTTIEMKDAALAERPDVATWEDTVKEVEDDLGDQIEALESTIAARDKEIIKLHDAAHARETAIIELGVTLTELKAECKESEEEASDLIGFLAELEEMKSASSLNVDDAIRERMALRDPKELARLQATNKAFHQVWKLANK